ncbi:MAG: c-type cytochrome [Planctomycetes bacterium]|nr:c-type cytochrome [Planctomycetota bacterium]
MARLTVIFWSCAAVAAAGCGKPDPKDRFQRPETITDFTTLYNTNCQGCHGPDGRMGPAPPLNDALFLAIVPDAELHKVIREGRKGTLMPGFIGRHGDSQARLAKGPIIGTGMLTEKQIDIVVKGMRKAWGTKVDGALPRYLDGAAVKKDLAGADLANGKAVFAQACASCHGDKGQGTKSAGAINQPAFLSLVSDQLLRRIIITGRPDLGMPNYQENAGDMSANDIRDLGGLLNSWRNSSGNGGKNGSKR